MMKNASIKEMIRKQKLDASDRRELVSGSPIDCSNRSFVFVGNPRQEAAAAEQADQ